MTGGRFTSLDSGGASDPSRFVGQSHIYGPSYLHLPALTIGLLGVQLAWSTEMSYGSPYLISLGLSKSSMAIVFVAGPLSGLVMAPLIGLMADTCTSRWGRRRPFMLFGIIGTVLALLLLGWTRHVAGWFTSQTDTLTMWLAVLAIYVIDFSINAVQAVDRALVVDVLPASAQAAGNAWAARMFGIGSVVGFFTGNLDIPRIFPFLGNTQLEGLTIIVSVLLLGCHLVTALMVKEKILLKPDPLRGGAPKRTFFGEIKDMFTYMLLLPRSIKQICMIQFFSWIAWFPVLFYTSLYVGDLHKRAVLQDAVATDDIMVNIDLNVLDAESTRLGSRALFFSSIVTVIANFMMPLFIWETQAEPEYDHVPTTPSKVHSHRKLRIPDAVKVHLGSLWAVSQGLFSACMFGTFFVSSAAGATILVTITGFSWAITQWAPHSLMAEAILTESPVGSDAESIRLTDTRSQFTGHVRRSSTFSTRLSESSQREGVVLFDATSGEPKDPDPDSVASDDEMDAEARDREEREKHRRRLILGNAAAGQSYPSLHENGNGYGNSNLEDDEREDAALVGNTVDLEGGSDPASNRPQGLSAKAGVILGIHNTAIVIPQFVVTGLSSIIFALFDPGKSALHRSHGLPPNLPAANDTSPALLSRQQDDIQDALDSVSSDSVVYVFRIGGVSALIAGILCYRMIKELKNR